MTTPQDTTLEEIFDRIARSIIYLYFTRMSRHKLVKALDIDEELDDFDGGVEPEYDEEVSVEDKGTGRHSL